TDREIITAVNVINLQSIFNLSLVMVFAHAMLILAFFWHYTAYNRINNLWHLGIMSAHAVMLCIIASLGFACWYLNRHQLAESRAAGIITILTSAGYLSFGVVLSLIDQMVMPATAIIPFLIACMGMAITVINSPRTSIIQYTLALLLLFISFVLKQSNTDVIMSITVNSMFVVAIALTMAIIRWQTTITDLEQKRYIKIQNQELEQKNQQLQYNATHDYLTGFFTRHEFIGFAEREIARNRRGGKEACGIIIDMDYFKQINDHHGHPAGDFVLQEVAAAIRSALRVMDIPARFGGEEFVILLPETSLDGGEKAAERIREAIQALKIIVDGKEILVTASFGVAALGESFNTFYNAADLALYQAKAAGRNRVCL
ncbi:MAG: GGDEF domain-containing protein, partial [Methylocystaceae bacterium]